MTVKHFAKTAAYAAGMFAFGIKPNYKPEPEVDIEAHIAAVQASFMSAVKDDLK